MGMEIIEKALAKRWGDAGVERATMIREAFPNDNEEAIAIAILEYKGNYPPYPRDIDEAVGRYSIDDIFMTAIRKVNSLTRDHQLESQRRKIRRELM